MVGVDWVFVVAVAVVDSVETRPRDLLQRLGVHPGNWLIQILIRNQTKHCHYSGSYHSHIGYGFALLREGG